jgi:single-strand DNA-binding protein
MTFTLATTERLPGRDETQWHNIVAWGHLADLILLKGDKLFISGKITYRSYEKEGTTRYITEIVASRIEIIASRKEMVRPADTPVNDTSTAEPEPWDGFEKV